MDFTVFKAFRYSFSEAIPIFFNRLKSVFFPCPIAIQFSPVIRTFAHSHIRTVNSGFQKELESIFFPVLMLFFALRFRVRFLLYWKTLLQGITSLFSFSIYKITGINVLQFRKGLWYNNEGDIGDCLYCNTAEKNNKHRSFVLRLI